MKNKKKLKIFIFSGLLSLISSIFLFPSFAGTVDIDFKEEAGLFVPKVEGSAYLYGWSEGIPDGSRTMYMLCLRPEEDCALTLDTEITTKKGNIVIDGAEEGEDFFYVWVWYYNEKHV